MNHIYRTLQCYASSGGQLAVNNRQIRAQETKDLKQKEETTHTQSEYKGIVTVWMFHSNDDAKYCTCVRA